MTRMRGAAVELLRPKKNAQPMDLLALVRETDWRNRPEVHDLAQRRATVLQRGPALEKTLAEAQARSAASREALDNARVDAQLGVASGEDIERLRREYEVAARDVEEAEAETDAHRRAVARINQLVAETESRAKEQAALIALDAHRQAVIRLDEALEQASKAAEECYRIREAIVDQFPGRQYWEPFFIPGIPTGLLGICMKWWERLRLREGATSQDRDISPVSDLEFWRNQLRLIGIREEEGR